MWLARLLAVTTCSTALGAILLSCSQSSPTPAALPDCDAGAQCGSFGVTGGGGGTPPPEAGSGGDCGSIVSSDNVCNACLANMCCARNATCSASADCLAIVSCVKACAPNDVACETRCSDKSQNGVAAYQNFIDCTAISCATQCQSGDGGACGSPVFSGTVCTSCVSAACCTENASCAGSAACLTLVACAFACQPNDQACVAGCETSFPDGDGPYRLLTQCVLSSCSVSCP